MDSSSSSSSQGLFSTSVDLEAGSSGSSFYYKPRRLFYEGLEKEDGEDYEPRHFLDFCSLCRKPLAGPCDIFMYRGDTPFCSQECRQEQIDMDEAKEIKSWKLPAKASSSGKERQKSAAAAGGAESRKIHVMASTAVAG